MVLARALQFTQWARRNARILIVVSVLAVIVVGGLIYYRSYQAERAERAAVDFMVLEQSFAAAADPGLVAADLERFASRYSGTVYADEARVLLGRLRLQQGEVAQAIPVLQEAARRLGSPMGAQAALLLGAAQEQAGDAQAAVETYLRVGREARFEFERRQGLESAAAAREAAGDHAGAAELYRQLAGIAETGTMDRSIYEMRAVEAEERARAQ